MTDNRPPDRGRGREKCPGSKSARKNLFGRDQAIGDSHLAREMEEMQQRENERFKERWNYDITSDSKLPGRYEWEKLSELDSPGHSLLHIPHLEDKSKGDASSVPGCSSKKLTEHDSSTDNLQKPEKSTSTGETVPKRARDPSPDGDQPPAKSPRR